MVDMAKLMVIRHSLAKANEEAHSTKAYTEQSAAKMQMGLLEDLPPMSQEYLDKLEHIRGAVAHHVYEEEGKWFLDLKKKLPAADQTKLTFRYKEQFFRYVGEGGGDRSSRPDESTTSIAREPTRGIDGRL